MPRAGLTLCRPLLNVVIGFSGGWGEGGGVVCSAVVASKPDRLNLILKKKKPRHSEKTLGR